MICDIRLVNENVECKDGETLELSVIQFSRLSRWYST